jgi:hypothetical protein
MADIHGLIQGASALGYAEIAGCEALRLAGGASLTEQPSSVWRSPAATSPVAINPSLASLLGDEVQQCIDACDDLELLGGQVRMLST